ncbi:MAG TPA: zinc ribbon domain-containing protein [Pyrinomonadaceae bacterium]|nr:zinc ribbon domain-containing protein [Pyrinomonadaceae bacterium]
MFCPKCATQNVDGASYCRSCGANISLVPQALTGQLPANDQSQPPDRYARRKRRPEASIEEAIRTITMGIAFAIISVLVARYAPAGEIWWFWMLIPAFALFGKGLSEIVRVRMAKKQAQLANEQPQLNTVRPRDIPSPQTGELRPAVPSVTEGTTRHLGAEAKTRPFEFSDTQKPS